MGANSQIIITILHPETPQRHVRIIRQRKDYDNAQGHIISKDNSGPGRFTNVRTRIRISSRYTTYLHNTRNLGWSQKYTVDTNKTLSLRSFLKARVWKRGTRKPQVLNCLVSAPLILSLSTLSWRAEFPPDIKLIQDCVSF